MCIVVSPPFPSWRFSAARLPKERLNVMDTPRLNLAGRVTRELVRNAIFSDAPLVLADVGVSGGIPAYWRQFEPHLAAFGFDTLVRECERLNREEPNPRVRYFDRFVGWDGYREFFP